MVLDLSDPILYLFSGSYFLFWAPFKNTLFFSYSPLQQQICSPSVWMLCLSACLFKATPPLKTPPSLLIGQLSQSWTSTISLSTLASLTFSSSFFFSKCFSMCLVTVALDVIMYSGPRDWTSSLNPLLSTKLIGGTSPRNSASRFAPSSYQGCDVWSWYDFLNCRVASHILTHIWLCCLSGGDVFPPWVSFVLHVFLFSPLRLIWWGCGSVFRSTYRPITDIPCCDITTLRTTSCRV